MKGGVMKKLEAKNLAEPDESRETPKATGALVHVGDHTVGSGRVQPGWRWSNDLRPIAGTASCEFEHTGFVISGVLHVEMNDGTELDLKPGDVYIIPPGHDAWVVGDQLYEAVDWGPRAEEFAKPPSTS